MFTGYNVNLLSSTTVNGTDTPASLIGSVDTSAAESLLSKIKALVSAFAGTDFPQIKAAADALTAAGGKLTLEQQRKLNELAIEKSLENMFTGDPDTALVQMLTVQTGSYEKPDKIKQLKLSIARKFSSQIDFSIPSIKTRIIEKIQLEPLKATVQLEDKDIWTAVFGSIVDRKMLEKPAHMLEPVSVLYEGWITDPQLSSLVSQQEALEIIAEAGEFETAEVQEQFATITTARQQLQLAAQGQDPAVIRQAIAGAQAVGVPTQVAEGKYDTIKAAREAHLQAVLLSGDAERIELAIADAEAVDVVTPIAREKLQKIRTLNQALATEDAAEIGPAIAAAQQAGVDTTIARNRLQKIQGLNAALGTGNAEQIRAAMDEARAAGMTKLQDANNRWFQIRFAQVLATNNPELIQCVIDTARANSVEVSAEDIELFEQIQALVDALAQGDPGAGKAAADALAEAGVALTVQHRRNLDALIMDAAVGDIFGPAFVQMDDRFGSAFVQMDGPSQRVASPAYGKPDKIRQLKLIIASKFSSETFNISTMKDKIIDKMKTFTASPIAPLFNKKNLL